MGDVKEKNLEDGIYKGYINGLNDPYSVYYNKKETKELYESTGGEYSGIGAVMSQNTETGVITLVQIYKDSPAEKAGLKDNDILYKVEGKEVTGKDLSKVVSKVKGEKGTTVELTVLRGENAKEVTVTATRDTVQAQTIEYKLMDDKIGYIRVSEFDTVTYDQYEEALDDLEKQGMTGLVVDLRNNPGGSLSTVCDMLDLMLPKGLIVYTEDKDGKKTEMKSDEEIAAIKESKKKWACIGHELDYANRSWIQPGQWDTKKMQAWNEDAAKMYASWEKDIMVEEYQIEDAELVLTAYGISARICKSVVDILRKEGYKIGLIRPITVSPFPYASYDKINYDICKAVLDVEMSIPAQFVEDVEMGVKGRCAIETCLCSGGNIMSREAVIEAVKKILG